MKRHFSPFTDDIFDFQVDRMTRWWYKMLDACRQSDEIFIGPHGVVWRRSWGSENIWQAEGIWIGWHCLGDEANPEWWYTYGTTTEDGLRIWLQKTIAQNRKKYRWTLDRTDGVHVVCIDPPHIEID